MGDATDDFLDNDYFYGEDSEDDECDIECLVCDKPININEASLNKGIHFSCD